MAKPTQNIPVSLLSDTKKNVFANKVLVDWFQDATNEIQAETMRKQTEASPLVATQLLSRFGLKHPRDLQYFLRSPAGKNLQSLINQNIAALQARQLNAANNQIEQKRLRSLAMLFLGLAYKKDAQAEKRILQFNTERVQKQLQAGEKAIQVNQKQQAEAMRKASVESLKESETLYNGSSEALQETLNTQDETLQQLEDELDSIEQAEAHQNERASFFENLLDNIEQFFDLDDEEQALLTQKNPDLMHRFSRDHVITKDEGKAFLLKRGQKLDDLSSAEKEEAHKAYQQLEPSLNDLKQTVKTSHQDEQKQHAERKARCVNQCAKLHQEIALLTQKLAQIQTVLHDTQQEMQAFSLRPQLAPTQEQRRTQQEEAKQEKKQEQQHKQNMQHTHNPRMHMSPRAEATPDTAVLTRSFSLMLRIDPRAAMEAMDRLGTPQFLQPTEFGMPIEDITMRSLQKHRAGRAGALANAIARSAITEVSDRAHERLHPDPKPEANPKAQLQALTQPKPEHKPEPENKYTSPSPFSTKPRPGG